MVVGLITIGPKAKAFDDKACRSLSECEGIYENGFCSICDGYEPAGVVGETYYSELAATHNDYYVIENAGQLFWFAGLVNGTLEGVQKNTKANAVLVTDIDINPGYVFTTASDGALTVTKDAIAVSEGWRSWTPIGNSEIFCGDFDGASYSVSGVYIKTTADEQGLFGCSAGNIKGVGVENSYICSSSGSGIGAVVGFNTSIVNSGYAGTLTDCYNSGFVYGSRETGGVCGSSGRPITNCYNEGKVKGNDLIGGVCGCITYTGQMTGCYNTGPVNGADSVGGVWGYNQSNKSCSDCYNTGAVSGERYVGGVSGSNFGAIEKCYNTGSVTVTDNYFGDDVGGLCGENYDTVNNCYNTGTVKGAYDTGGLFGYNADVVKNCYSTGNVTGEACGGICGSNTGQFIKCYFNYSGFKGPGINIDQDDYTQDITAKFPPAFKNGEIAYLLNGGATSGSSVVWYQDVNVDASPRLSGPTVIMQDGVYYSEYIKGKTDETVVDTVNKTILTSVMGCAQLTDIAKIPAGYTTKFDGLLGTGSVIKVYNSAGKLVAEYTAIVTGEVNGDGVCDVLDCSVVERTANGNLILDETYELAADMNNDNIVDKNDYQNIINNALA